MNAVEGLEFIPILGVHGHWVVRVLWSTVFHPSACLLTCHIFILSSSTTRPISTKLKRRYMAEILSIRHETLSNPINQTWQKASSGEGPFPKIHWRNLIIFSRTTGPIFTKLGTKLPWVTRIQVCSNKGPFNVAHGPLVIRSSQRTGTFILVTCTKCLAVELSLPVLTSYM